MTVKQISDGANDLLLFIFQSIQKRSGYETMRDTRIELNSNPGLGV